MLQCLGYFFEIYQISIGQEQSALNAFSICLQAPPANANVWQTSRRELAMWFRHPTRENKNHSDNQSG